MNELWEYTPTNLLVARLFDIPFFTSDDIPTSWGSREHGTWPMSGYREAICFYNTAIQQHRRTNNPSPLVSKVSHGKQVPHPNCMCGLYGCMSLNYLQERYGYHWPIALAENAGNMIIHDTGIVRAEKQQVIAMLESTETEEYAEYFNVPIIEPDQAQEMINKQMEVWGVELPIGVQNDQN